MSGKTWQSDEAEALVDEHPLAYKDGLFLAIRRAEIEDQGAETFRIGLAEALADSCSTQLARTSQSRQLLQFPPGTARSIRIASSTPASASS